MPRKPHSLSLLHLMILFVGIWFGTCHAAPSMPEALTGQWFTLSGGEDQSAENALRESQRTVIQGDIPLTGGSFWHDASLDIATAGNYVIDFKNSSVIGLFEHFVYDAKGQLIVHVRGGIQAQSVNPFHMRHGRKLELAVGHYRVLTHMQSPFYLANPSPYIDTLAHYEQAIKPGNALVLICLGLFVGLGTYYTALALIRRRLADVMYAFFIGANFIYNASALLVFSDTLGIHEFYLISFPILLSNIAYIQFVSSLLEINKGDHPKLWGAAKCVMAVMVGLLLFALTHPNWSLEMDRYGVGIMLIFGFVAGTSRMLQKNVTARLYLFANIAFLIPGMASISLTRVEGIYTLYAEHLGLVAVALEVMCLALVIAHQFAQIQRDRTHALARAEENLLIATTDPLTGLPNRLALEMSMSPVPKNASLSVIDLDGLKRYNDLFGHARGDELLRAFARECTLKLPARARLFRHGGDEFAIVAVPSAADELEQALQDTVRSLHACGFTMIDASIGTVLTEECENASELKHIADMRMYDNKRERKSRYPDNANQIQ